VRFQIDGVTTEERSGAPYEIAITVPHGVPSFSVTALALDAAGKTLAVAEERIQSRRAEATAVDLRLTNPEGQPLRSQPVELWANGLRAEYFDFRRPLVAIPDLDNEKPAATGYVAGLDRRNPDGIFGQDPWGLRMFPDYAAQFSGWLHMPEAGQYRFALRSQEGARLRIGGQEVLMIPGGVSSSRSAEAIVTLPQGLLPLMLEHYETVASPELILEWAPPGQTLGPLPRKALWVPIAQDEALRTDSSGRLRVPDVPGHLGALTLWDAESGWMGVVEPLPLSRGQRLELQSSRGFALEQQAREENDLDKENQ
jgi:hypothetical protein